VAYLKNTSDDNVEAPSLGVVIPAGHAVAFDVPDGVDLADHPVLSATKTKPSGVPISDPNASVPDDTTTTDSEGN
jgi:hypothetical protein